MVVDVAAVSGANAQAVLDELSSEIDRLNKENAALRQRVQLLMHRLFGRRSEKGVPMVEQGVLPFEPTVAGPVQLQTTDEAQPEGTGEPPLRRRHPGRRRLPANLPRERIELVPPANERHCATCDTAKVRIGADTTEAGLRARVVRDSGICAAEVRVCELPAWRRTGCVAGTAD